MLQKDLISRIEWVNPGPQASEIVNNFKNWRHLPLTKLNRLDRMCVWCNVNPVGKGRIRYCSTNCRESAYIYAEPRSPQTKMYVLIEKQNCTCAQCGKSFEKLLQERIENETKKRRQWDGWGVAYSLKTQVKISYWHLGCGTGDIWQINHKIPILRGGEGIGLENLQVICSQCHYQKIKKDRV